MLDLGRQLLVRSLLAEAVEEVSRQLLDIPDLRRSDILPEDQAQNIWQAIKQDQWLLQEAELVGGGPVGNYFLTREDLLQSNSTGWDSESSCCAILTWEFNSSGTLTAFEAISGFGWNQLSFNFRRLLVLPADAGVGS